VLGTELRSLNHHPKGVDMKKIFLSLLGTLSLLIMSGCSLDEKPSTEQVEPALRAYLTMEKAKSCGGTVTVDRLSILRIGDFESKLDGFPVYATFGVTCTEGSNFSVWNNDDTSSTGLTTVVRKKSTGEFECFMPDVFKERQNAMQKGVDQVPQEMMKTEAPKPVGVGR
jgi:hypothetical protein